MKKPRFWPVQTERCELERPQAENGRTCFLLRKKQAEDGAAPRHQLPPLQPRRSNGAGQGYGTLPAAAAPGCRRGHGPGSIGWERVQADSQGPVDRRRMRSCTIPTCCWESRTKTVTPSHHVQSPPSSRPRARRGSSQFKGTPFKHHLPGPYRRQSLSFAPRNRNRDWKRGRSTRLPW